MSVPDNFLSSAFVKSVLGYISNGAKYIAEANAIMQDILGAAGAAIVGGAASVLGGGKFANGAQTAAIQYLFNEAVSDDGKKSLNPFKIIAKEFPKWWGSDETADLRSGLKYTAAGVATVATGGAAATAMNSGKVSDITIKAVNSVNAVAARGAALTVTATEAVIVTTAPIITNPNVQQNAVDFVNGAVDPGPAPTTPAGTAGYLTGKAFEKILGD